MGLLNKEIRSILVTQSQSCLKINSILISSMLDAMILERQLTVRMLSRLIRVVENAKLFKEDLLRRNVKNSNSLNL